MREIKFRARRVDTGAWVYGFLFETPLTAENFEAGSFQSGVLGACISDGDGAVCRINPKTIGQYIGIKDKSGVEIYDGDKISLWYEEMFFQGIVVGEIEWDDNDACFKLMFSENGSSLHICGIDADFAELEVIGNIYENKELLNG